MLWKIWCVIAWSFRVAAVLAGQTLAYGVAHADLFRQSAAHVDKILRGGKPGNLPVEQPTRLVIE